MYRRILVPLDGSQLAECVLPHVEAIVSGCQIQNIVLARVVEPYVPVRGKAYYSLLPEEYKEDWKWVEVGKSAAEKYLNEIAGRLRVGGRNVESKVLVGGARPSQLPQGKNRPHHHSDPDDPRDRWSWGAQRRIARSACAPS
jgi:nucleotide-binding universal stress UspA family protein